MPLDQDLPEEGLEKEMSFLDHLEELRWHVVRSLAAVVTFTIGSFLIARWVFDKIVFAPARPDFITFRGLCKLGELFGSHGLCVEEFSFKIQSRLMTGQFSMHILASFTMGLIIAFPYVVWEVWRFIKPGLYNKEKKYSRGAVASISFLFLVGVSFGYFVLAPLMVYFLANYSISEIIQNEFDITSYVTTIVTLVFGCGLLFQLPVIIFFLTRIGLVSSLFLRHYRKHSIIIILIIGAVLTPPDPISQSLIALPLFLLYEISILIAQRVERNKLRDEEAEKLNDEQATS